MTVTRPRASRIVAKRTVGSRLALSCSPFLSRSGDSDGPGRDWAQYGQARQPSPADGHLH